MFFPSICATLGALLARVETQMGAHKRDKLNMVYCKTVLTGENNITSQ